MEHNTRKRKIEVPTNTMSIAVDSKREFMARFKKDNNSQGGKTPQKMVESFEPRGINVLEHAEARALEIRNLKSTLVEASKAQNSLYFQQLPRHMRRRAGNHDVRRAPKRVRPPPNKKQINNQPVIGVKEKKKNRKQRRKPKQLFEEYRKRQEGYKWLETHIWHAKRFHMAQGWGYKVPERTFAKAVRSSYRAAKNSCLLQDCSYYEVIEISTHQNDIIKILEMVSPVTDLTTSFFESTDYMNIILYHNNAYPYGAIGPVKIFWGSLVEEEDKRKLIMICHPSISTEIYKELQNIAEACTEREEKRTKITKHCLEFVIFKLTGKQSASILTSVLQPHPGHCVVGPSLHSEISIATSSPKNTILNTYVKDPRFHIPDKKKNPLKNTVEKNDPGEPSTNQVNNTFGGFSEIWNEAMRKKCSDSKIPDADVNKLREQLLYQVNELPTQGPVVPVVLLSTQSKAKTDDNLTGGFELILPSSWAMPFWIALIYQGARAGGREEESNVYFEASSLPFPNGYPDTLAGSEINADVANSKQQKYDRVPPAKRLSFEPLGIQFPHSFPWLSLNKEWRFNLDRLLKVKHNLNNDIKDQFFVLRDTDILQQFIVKLKNPKEAFEVMDIQRFENALIPLRIAAVQQGTPEDNTVLCIPTLQDLQDLKNSNADEFSEYRGPIEPQHKGLKHSFPFIYKEFDDLAYHNVRLIGKSTRWLIGFVQTGHYSFAAAKGAGVGFVSALGLYYYLKTVVCNNQDHLLLFRNTKTLQYRFCKVDVIL